MIMLVKELLAIKPGTFIKGIKLYNNYDPASPYSFEGRKASLSVRNWETFKEVDSSYVLRTPWYNDPIFETYDGKQAFNMLKSGDLFVTEDQLVDEVYGEGFESMGWSHFRYNEPIGIHLGTFGIFVSEAEKDSIVVYSKILRCDGQTGFLGCTTRDVNKKDLELL